MKNVYIHGRTVLDERDIAKEFNMVNSCAQADVIIAQSTLPKDLNNNFGKLIYVAVEPPRSHHRLFCYSHFNDFKLVVAHNPDPSRANQIPFTSDDSCQFYPTRPDPYPFITRENLDFRHKGVFYAGRQSPDGDDVFGAKSITHLRPIIGNYNAKHFRGSVNLGIGWGNQMRKVDNWREDKLHQINNSETDFVLALENTVLPNYLYEKIWDGIAADKVTLYLGDPRIEHHIPLNCFVDLRQWFDYDTKIFDVDGMGEYLKNMTQDEYNEIIKNARAFRDTCPGKFYFYTQELTQKLINFIKDDKL